MLVLVLSACTKTYPPLEGGPPPALVSPNYIIGAGDNVNIFVWRNDELSASVTVRPDGKITTPLIEDVPASGKTPTQLAREMEKELEVYVKNPVVTVMVNGFVGPYSEQIRVVGQATNPQALPYRDQMSLLDLMIAVGGMTDFADGNNSKVVRVVDGNWQEFSVRIDDLINGADINANVYMLPGDILIIPESWF
jgi:polysaccharide export outer membrane protein